MPRKDPITGVMVMTTGEFFNKEAEIEGRGRSGGDLMVEMFQEMDREKETERKRCFDPVYAMSLISAKVAEWNKMDDVDAVTEVKSVEKVVEVDLNWTLNSDRFKITALVETLDGQLGIVIVSEFSFHGTFYEPPEYEFDVTWGKARRDT